MRPLDNLSRQLTYFIGRENEVDARLIPARNTVPGLPGGTVTFLFTDIEGSTRLWEQHPESMRLALARHDALMRSAIQRHDGHIFKTMGDAFCTAFHTAPDALNAALAAQQALTSEPWPDGLIIKVRMAVHTGAAEVRDNDYFGQSLNRVARLLAVGHGRQVLLSLATEELTNDALPLEASLKALGEHRLRDLSRPETIFQLLHPQLTADFPPLKSLGGFSNNLPLQLTSFIGREKEITEVKNLLAGTRLLTLTGSGGCGKTRLSLQVAADVLDQYPDGVWLVELTSLADPALVPQTVASAWGLTEQAGKTFIQTLTDYLKSKHLLLVLDNCEHLLSACAHLCDALLRACPRLTIIASSRERLGIAGEQSYRVPSLAVPNLKQVLTLGQVSQYEAARLFIERATTNKADFVLSDHNAHALALVCHRLDGIPLAIELAAARVRSLSVDEINTRLDNRFRLLTGGSKTALPRQQTLQALIDWSYNLLSAQEKVLLSRLSAFAGGWTLKAAEQVGSGENASGGGIEDWEVLDVLTSLVDKSLVITETSGETTRYRLLETVREYGRDRLTEIGESTEVRTRHRDYYLTLAEEIRPKLSGSEQTHWLAVLEEEYDNLRLALTFCLEKAQDVEAGLRLGGALQQFWWKRGHLSEGRQYLAAVLSRTEGQDHLMAYADVLNGAGVLARMQSNYDAAQDFFVKSLAIRRKLGHKQGIAASLGNLGNVAYIQGDYALARALHEECLTIQRELQDNRGISYCLHNLGLVASDQGDYATAFALYEESLTIEQALKAPWGIAASLHSLGLLAQDLDDYAKAHARHQESLAMRRDLSDQTGITNSLEAYASLALKEQQVERAAQLWGAAVALREALGMPLPNRHEKYDQNIAHARSALGEPVFTAAFEAVALALGEAE